MTSSQLSTENPTSTSVFDQHPRWLLTCLLLMFFLAGVVRLYRINAPGVLIDREYTSAIFARSFYFQMSDSVAEWRKDIALLTKQNQPALEPPVTEFLVALIYWVTGGEKLWAAHLLTSLFWLIGGVFFYKTAKILLSTDAAVIATSYYLFVPLGILTSRSFQADSLMMMLFMLSLFSMLNSFESPKKHSLWIAAIITAIALLYRPLILFGLMGTFTLLTIQRRNQWKDLFRKEYILFGVVSLLPAILYYGYGIVLAGYLRWKIGTSFRPELYFYRVYWEGWLTLAVKGVGYLALVGSLLGLPFAKGKARSTLIGLWVGYIVFGLLFTMHIHTHTYYHAQLIPIVALSFSPLVVLLVNQLRQLTNSWFWWLPVAGALMLIMYFGVGEVRSSVGAQSFENPQIAREVGKIVHHSSRTIYLSRFYGMPLQYYGEFTGAYWPRKTGYWVYLESDYQNLSIQDRLDDLGFAPEYFVITDFAEFEKNHEDLNVFLEQNCTLIAETEHYLIYDGACAKPTAQ